MNRPFESRVKTFVRRDRRLPQSQLRHFAENRAGFVLDVTRGTGVTEVATDQPPLDFQGLFGNSNPVTVEIGSGNGIQIVAAAAANPKHNFLAFEVYHPGIVKTVGRALDAGVTAGSNLRLVEADALQAIPVLVPEGTLSEIWSFFPDPWRKKRHHKRRLISARPLALLSKYLQRDGVWRMATDWADYALDMVSAVSKCDRLDNPYAERPGEIPIAADGTLLTTPDMVPRFRPGDQLPEGAGFALGFAPRFPGRVLTHFEQRGIHAGRVISDVMAIRK
ncbi:MAG: tRNA (guanosine(46)-N7)-methyltransferase TrmB [Varibaculum sp.]|nr:tRNA (guanosine(46)-N7)-methyltransferase TrmB [Varibaculum sp.]